MSEPSLTPEQLKLIDAVRSNDLSAARVLLESGINPNFYIDDRLNTLIDSALGCFSHPAYRDMLRLLIKYGADYETLPWGTSIISQIVYSGDVGRLKMLIEAGATIHEPLYGRDGLIASACESCRREMVEYLLNLGDPHPHELGYCLMSAVGAPWYCNAGVDRVYPVAKILIQAGADVNYTTDQGWSVIDEALSNDDTATVRLLLDHGAHQSINHDFFSLIDGVGASLGPALRGFLPAESVDDHLVFEKNGQKLLQLIITKDARALESFLEEKTEEGTLDPSFTNERGETALCLAYRSGFKKGYELLLKHRADSNYADVYSGVTPLMRLAENPDSCADDVHFLVENGAEVHRRSYADESALGVYCRCQRPDLALALISHFSEIRYEDAGHTISSLHLARQYNLLELVQPLLDLGAVDE